MPEVKKDYIPIDELESPRLRFVAQLPSFVDSHHIGVNLNRATLLCRLGGISHLRFEGLTDQETSSFVPAIVGFDTQGNTYAAKTGLKTSVPTYTVDSQPDSDRSLGSRWVNGVVKINIDETANRILNETKWRNGISSNDAWSYHLNQIIKGSIVDIGNRHLILGAKFVDYFKECFPVALTTIDFLTGGNALRMYGLWYLWANVVTPFKDRSPEGHRQSLLLYGPQLDRAILLKLISVKSTLVKSLHRF